MHRRSVLNGPSVTIKTGTFKTGSGTGASAAVGASFRSSARRLMQLAPTPFVWGLLAMFALALLARLVALGGKPLWLDEVFTVLRSSRPISGVITDSLQNRHLPSFFLIEHAMLSLGGSPAILRIVPALAGAATAPLAFAIAWKLGGRSAAWLAGLLLALAPLQVAFGQEARSYTLMMALIMLALLGLIILAKKPEQATTWLMAPGAPRGAWAAYGFGTLGALLVLGNALPWLIAANIAMAVGILPRTRSRGGFLRNWLLVHLAILLIAIPAYAALMAAVHDQVLQSFFWIPPLSLSTAWMDAASLYGLRDATMVTMRLLPTSFAGLVFVLFALAGFGAWRLRSEPGPLIVLAIAFLGLPAALATVSLLHPVMLPRYLLWSVGPFFVLAGFAIEIVPSRLRSAALAIAALVAVANLLSYYSAETKPRWDRAAEMLAERFVPGDLLLVSDGAAPVMLNFYRPQIHAHRSPWPATRDPKQAAAVLASGHRIFVVYGPAGQGKQPNRARFFATAAQLGEASAPQSAGSAITIEEINSPADGPAIAGPDEQPRG